MPHKVFADYPSVVCRDIEKLYRLYPLFIVFFAGPPDDPRVLEYRKQRRIRMAIDMEKLNVFVGQFVGDLGAAVHSGMVVIGEKLGLYKALAEGPSTSAELAVKTR